MGADAAPAPVRVEIRAEPDIVEARQRGREMAAASGVDGVDLTLVATAISEITRNILKYADRGEVELRRVTREGRTGLMVIARDEGPGIDDVQRALEDGYSTGDGLGLGLPGSRRLMDEFEIHSVLGEGTTITMIKWARGG